MKNTFTLVWIAGHVVLIVAIYAALLWARQSALATFATPETQASWEQWREDAGQTDGPVVRRRPKSGEPPALVLMRDMFWTCVIAAWVAGSVLFFFLMAVVRGMVLAKPPQVDLSDPPEIQPPR